MPRFSDRSEGNLKTCDEKIQALFNEVIEHWNCIVTEGYRGRKRQNKYYRSGKSNLKFPNSKHNIKPSKAVHVAPYHSKDPHIRWNNTLELSHFAGFVKGIAVKLGIKIRWGGDWDMDGIPVADDKDETLEDYIHFELVGG